MSADKTLRADGIVGHPDAMGVGAEMRGESRTKLGQNTSLAPGKRSFAFVNRRWTNAEHLIGAQVIDGLKDRVGVDSVGSLLHVGSWDDAVGQERADDVAIFGGESFFHLPRPRRSGDKVRRRVRRTRGRRQKLCA